MRKSGLDRRRRNSDRVGGAAPRGRTLTSLVVAAATLLTSVGIAQPAAAAEGDGSTAAGRVLSGTLLSSLSADVLAALDGANASSGGLDDDVDNGDLDVTALSTLSLTVAGGVQIPLTVADLGVLSEYAEANSDGSAIGASGAVGDDGTIAVGPADPGAPSAFTFSLSQLLDPAITSTIADASLEVGAVSARAETDGAAPPTGDYDIAALRLALDSPVVAGLSGSIRTAVAGAVTPAVNGLVGPGGTIASAVATASGLPLNAASTSVGLTVNLPAALDPILGPTAPALGAGGPIQIDLASGEILVDIRALLAADGQDLNALGPNTEVLSADVLALITEGVANLLDTLVDDVVAAVQTALQQAVLTVSATLRATLPIVGAVDVLRVGITGTVASVVAGTTPATVTVLNAGVCALPVVGAVVCGPGLPAAVLAAVGTQLSSTLLSPAPGGLLNTIAGTLQSAVVVPALALLDPALENVITEVISLQANVQEPTPPASGITFTETALRLTVLGFTGPAGALQLNLAQGAVGPADLTLPIVDALVPDRGPQTGGTAVTVTGSGFTGATGVTFGGIPGTGFTVVSDTQITVVSPPSAPGVVDLVILSPDGDSAPVDFTYFPVTQVTAVAPDSGPDAGGTTVTITGQCFTGATAVLFGTTPAASFTIVSDTQITAVTPAGAGLVDVSVTVPGECGTGTLPDAFAFVAPGAPIVAGIAPDRGPETGGTPVTITGTGFTGATSVTFDGVPGSAFTVVSDTQITVTTPPHVPATVPVVVVAPPGDSAPADFTYFQVTDVATVTPASGPEDGGTTVTITGDCFTGATAVLFGTTPATSFTVVSDTQITAVAPVGAGVVDITVVSPGECGAGTLPAAFEYLPAPSVASIVPDRGPETGGTVVTITGTSFTGATGVTFDGIAGTTFTVDSDTQITVTSPPHAPATVDLIVQSALGASDPVDFTYFAVTAVTSVAPPSGPTAGGNPVVITGQCFTGATAVLFSATPAASFVIVSDTQITAVAPAGTGLVDVSVVVPGECGTGVLPAAYAFVAPGAPIVTAIDPVRGPETGGTVVTITGTQFTAATGVTFDGLPGTAFTVDSDTQITVTTPAHAPGPVDVIIQSPAGDSAPADFVYFAVPAVASITPDSGPTAGGTVVTISGTGFTGATGVTFDGLPGTAFTVVSDTELTVTTPPHSAGVVDVVVSSPDAASDPVDFTYVAPPSVAAITPDSGPTTGGTAVTITGTGFTGATGVTFDGLPGTAFTVVSDTQITVSSPAHPVGTVDVVIQSPSGASAPVDFTYFAVPALTAITPPSGPVAGGTVVTITGSSFTAATSVTFDGLPGTALTVVSDTQLTVATPAHPAGPVAVVVVTPDATSAPGAFTYLAPPAVAALSPDSGPVAGGTVVTITGTGFTGATGVTFDGLAGTAFTVDSDTQIRVTSPAHPAGPVDLVVQSPLGASVPVDFTYLQVTAVTSVTPDSGPDVGGTTVVITGQCFTGATAVLFGAAPASSFTVLSDTQIEAVTPPGVGLVDVSVTAPGACGTGTLPDAFAFVAPGAPVVAGITPDRGPETGGTVVTLTGTGFTDASGVTFDGTPGTAFSVVSDTEITVSSPPGAPGPANVVVQHPDGDAAPVDFEYFDVTAVTGVTPGSGSEAGGQTVTITGSCFTGATAVLFGSTPATSFTVVSDTQITAVAPAGSGVVDITVTAPGDCGSGTLPDAFEYVAPGAPILTGLTPASGPSTGGTVVTLTGTGFTGATAVLFGTTPSTSFVVVSDTVIQAVAPANAPDIVDVVVRNPAGDSIGLPFEYILSTEVTGGTPVVTPEGTVVTITGTCFTGTTQVLFGSTPARSFTVVDDSTIRAVAPAGSGTTDITVLSPCGAFTLVDAFTYPGARAAALGLAQTGTDPSLAALSGILLALFGAVLVTRRRAPRW